MVWCSIHYYNTHDGNCPDCALDKKAYAHNVEFQHRLKVEQELERIRKLLEKARVEASNA